MLDPADLEGMLEVASKRAAMDLDAEYVVIIAFWADGDGKTIAGDGGTSPVPMVELYAQMFQQYGGLAYFLNRKPQPVPPPPMADASNAPP
jgi:hypothetical protein